MSKRGPGTRAVHGGRERVAGPLTTPVVQSSTFAFASSDEMRRYLEGDEDLYLYTRYANPTLRALEESLGADLVMHSLTKALSGHTDIIGGALLGSRERIDRARSYLKVLGGCMDPHPAFLVLRGLKTAADIIEDVEQALSGV